MIDIQESQRDSGSRVNGFHKHCHRSPSPASSVILQRTFSVYVLRLHFDRRKNRIVQNRAIFSAHNETNEEAFLNGIPFRFKFSFIENIVLDDVFASRHSTTIENRLSNNRMEFRERIDKSARFIFSRCCSLNS